MKEIAELRGQVGENLPAFKNEIGKLQCRDATNGKMKHLLAHLDKELQEEKDLAASLTKHIATQDADDLNTSAE